MIKYNRVLRFYIPTHSLLNYTQWKILSPEGVLVDLPAVDGYIAQVWTGTSRVANVYEGVVKERTFETAFLEYGIMQELAKGTGRRMWFLHDPIEDNPEYTWEDYRYNYLKTAVASLLHPAVSNYEICPWPRRVFDGVFPRKAGLASGTIPTTDMPGAKEIPPSYATLLNSMVQLFGDMDQADYSFDGVNGGIGILMSDSGLFQRSYPDGIVGEDQSTDLEKAMRNINHRMHHGEDCSKESRLLIEEASKEPELFHAFVQSGTFPNFFGMAMPLLKYGLPVRPVQLDNVRRYPGYLDNYNTLILSYEYMKPETPDVNNALAEWVKSGGMLAYIGDGSDPYHQINGWWNHSEAGSSSGARYHNPSEHLFEMMGLPLKPEDGITAVGKGRVMIWNIAPAKLCTNTSLAEEYRSRMKQLLSLNGSDWEFTNQLTLRRGPYIISAVMDEGRMLPQEEHSFRGLFADMLENDYTILSEKHIHKDENSILFDFAKIDGVDWRIIGCSARVFSLSALEDESGFTMEIKAADKIKAYLRIRLPRPVVLVNAVDEKGNRVEVEFQWEEQTRTILLGYESTNQTIDLKGYFIK
jgi:hypothetical protein